MQKANFQWNSLEKGMLLSSFSLGYFFAIIGGALASKFGGTKVLGLGVAFTGILTILTPLLIRVHIILFIIARICEGTAEVTVSFSKWSSSLLSVLLTFVYSLDCLRVSQRPLFQILFFDGRPPTNVLDFQQLATAAYLLLRLFRIRFWVIFWSFTVGKPCIISQVILLAYNDDEYIFRFLQI